jgi:predicted molibdopterin-dependent oxidoreductase YjgC
MMGVCQECVVHIDGHLRQACMVPVTPGLAITLGAGKLGAGTPGAGTPDAGAT